MIRLQVTVVYHAWNLHFAIKVFTCVHLIGSVELKSLPVKDCIVVKDFNLQVYGHGQGYKLPRRVQTSTMA